MDKKTLVIIDDKLVVGLAMKMALELHNPDIHVRVIGARRGLFELMEDNTVDVVLVNGRLDGEIRGPALVAEILRRFPGTKVGGFSVDDSLKETFLEAGATVYLSKNDAITDLERAIEKLLE